MSNLQQERVNSLWLITVRVCVCVYVCVCMRVGCVRMIYELQIATPVPRFSSLSF